MSRAARLGLIGLVSAWLIKFQLVFGLFWANVRHDIAHPLFPRVFESGVVSLVAYLLPIPMGTFIFMRMTQVRVLIAAVTFFICSGVLMLHANGHNDATYTCCFWVSLWLLWLGSQWKVAPNKLRAPAIILGHAIVGMVFLGGFVGKLTPEYWSGEALYHIYFIQRETLLFDTIRNHFEAGTMAEMAKVLARTAIYCEAFLACALVVPSRLLCWIGIPIIVCMIAVSSYMLYSVLGTMIFLILACDSMARIEAVTKDIATNPATAGGSAA